MMQRAASHQPVLLTSVLHHLSPKHGAIYVDGTFGAGGYTRGILEAANCNVIAIDRDPSVRPFVEALQREYNISPSPGSALAERTCRASSLDHSTPQAGAMGGAGRESNAFQGWGHSGAMPSQAPHLTSPRKQGEGLQRFTFIAGTFGEMEALLAAQGITEVDGIVLDIGVSSMQLDQAERGFSFQHDGPLDMRMSKSGMSAADLVNQYEEKAIADILFIYGEEKASRRIARAIVEARAAKPIGTTKELAQIVASAIGKREKKDPATRTFQALRIYVNDELRQLEKALESAERLLKPGGRLVVVVFHSLEDRIVKHFFRERSGKMGNASRHLPDVEAKTAPTFHLITTKGISANEDEIRLNPRARSATLRACERTEAPPSLSHPGRR